MLTLCMDHSRATAVFLSAFLLLPAARSQSLGPDEREVLGVIERFFGCLATRDSAGMSAIMEAEGTIAVVDIGPEARPVRTLTHAQYLGMVRKGKGTLTERYWDPTVRMDAGVAVVSCPYDLHFDGAFSHCGLDIFTLVRREGTWRIAGSVFSMRKEGCPPSPLGPLKD